jgi:type II secretory pathway component PulF
MGTSDIMRQYGLVVALGVGVIVYLLSEWLSTEAGRRRWQQMLLQIPVIGPLNAKFAMTRFCRMLGTLTGSGVALIQALRVARESIGNQTLTDAVSYSIDRVRQGEALAVSLRSCHQLFNGSTIEMISIAEESGTLDKELVRLANVTSKELDSQLRNAVALMEPLMLFIMAGVIGAIFMGMVLPIFTIQDYIK